MKRLMRGGLTMRQYYTLSSLKDGSSHTWDSVYVKVLESLMKKALVFKREGSKRFNGYYLTDLGFQVIGATRFDDGLKIGFEGYVKELDNARQQEDLQRQLAYNRRLCAAAPEMFDLFSRLIEARRKGVRDDLLETISEKFLVNLKKESTDET